MSDSNFEQSMHEARVSHKELTEDVQRKETALHNQITQHDMDHSLNEGTYQQVADTFKDLGSNKPTTNLTQAQEYAFKDFAKQQKLGPSANNLSGGKLVEEVRTKCAEKLSHTVDASKEELEAYVVSEFLMDDKIRQTGTFGDLSALGKDSTVGNFMDKLKNSGQTATKEKRDDFLQNFKSEVNDKGELDLAPATETLASLNRSSAAQVRATADLDKEILREQQRTLNSNLMEIAAPEQGHDISTPEEDRQNLADIVEPTAEHDISR